MKKFTQLASFALASALSIGLLGVPAGAASADSPSDCLKDIPYYGDLSQCRMTSAQALAYAETIEEEHKYMVSKNESSSQTTPGSIHSYAALIDIGTGNPVLFFAGGLVMEYSWSDSWQDNIREDGCDWSDIGKVKVVRYENGEIRTSTSGYRGKKTEIRASHLFIGGLQGSDGSSYYAQVFPFENGRISTASTSASYREKGLGTGEYVYEIDAVAVTQAEFEAWENTWDKADSLAGHIWDGGAGGRIYGMGKAEDVVAALRAYAEAKGMLAYARRQTIVIDNSEVTFKAYALKDAAGAETNYVRLRDVACALQETSIQFDVGWDGNVTITTGTAYNANGTEGWTPYVGDRDYEVCSAETVIDGMPVQLDAILLKDDSGNGYTYYKLRDLGDALGFTVDWSAEAGITIKTA